MSLQQQKGWHKAVRELAALGLWALAVYTVLSLVTYDAGCDHNLGGVVGGALARILERGVGHVSYVVVLLLVWLGRSVWAGASIRLLGRYTTGGMILLVALSASLGNFPALSPHNAASSIMASALPAHLHFSDFSLAVLIGIICALALLARRAPPRIAATSNAALTHARFGSGPEPNDSSRPREMLEISQFPTHSNARSSASTPTRASEPAPIVLAEEVRARPSRVRGAYRLPRLDLLDNPPLEKRTGDESELEGRGQILEEKLAAFGVQVRVIDIEPGPVVTLFKLEPGEGVKVSQIVNLADDLSLALRARSVRILAPIPGEAAVGIEIANDKREMVYLRELLKAGEFKTAASQLTIALGKDIAGRPVWADLATMPHLLIAGATGTGKSVSIHVMLASILFKATANDVRFVLIDPKMLELSVYEDIPHLLVPVVMDLEKAAAALSWATSEMEARYRVMREVGVRNVDSYNQVIKSGVAPQRTEMSESNADTLIKPRRLPKIVIVIDELADLLLSHGKTVERDITRLAQKARAAGIHLMLATQRPSVDVVTGLIKANLPARISFQVSSRVDSRTILDSIGAERLLGAGDMLFMSPGSAKLRRLHGPFVSEAEIRRICDCLRAQGAPEYQMQIFENLGSGREDESYKTDQRDPLYDEAVRIVLDTGQASISMIQRRLRIGYNRSARMVEYMEREGIVTPADGARPRELRVGPGFSEE